MTVNMQRTVPVSHEPLRKNRWSLSIPGLGFSEWMVQSTSRPSLSVNEVEIPFMNTSTWVAGRSVWESMDITFIDTITPSTSQKVMEWIRKCVEHSTGRMGYASDYKNQMVLTMLDPAGIPVQKWTIYGAFITSANFNDLDYGSDDIADLNITVRYDYAIMNF